MSYSTFNTSDIISPGIYDILLTENVTLEPGIPVNIDELYKSDRLEVHGLYEFRRRNTPIINISNPMYSIYFRKQILWMQLKPGYGTTEPVVVDKFTVIGKIIDTTHRSVNVDKISFSTISQNHIEMTHINGTDYCFLHNRDDKKTNLDSLSVLAYGLISGDDVIYTAVNTLNLCDVLPNIDTPKQIVLVTDCTSQIDSDLRQEMKDKYDTRDVRSMDIRDLNAMLDVCYHSGNSDIIDTIERTPEEIISIQMQYREYITQTFSRLIAEYESLRNIMIERELKEAMYFVSLCDILAKAVRLVDHTAKLSLDDHHSYLRRVSDIMKCSRLAIKMYNIPM